MLVASLLLLQTAVGPLDLPADARLDRSLAFEARIKSLPDVLDRLGRETGATLIVERRMTSLKVTILVPLRPARRTMADLANVFDAQWIPIEGGYRLEETVPARNRREIHLRLEAELARKQAMVHLTGNVPDPFGDVAPEGLSEERVARMRAQSRDANQEAAAFYRSLPPTAIDRLWRGEPVYRVAEDGPKGERSLRIVRFEPELGSFQTITLLGSGSERGSQSSVVGDLSDLTTARSAFLKAQSQWATALSVPPAPELELAMNPVPVPKPGWIEGFTETDRLEMLYRRSGIPIVAEATRFRTGGGAGLNEKTLGEALRGPDAPEGFFRFDGGALLYRPSLFWRRRRTEPSEAAIALVEGTARPSVDQVAELFATVPRIVVPSLFDRVSRVELWPYERSAAGLRLWGSLTSRQRETLRRGRTLQVGGLRPNVRALLPGIVIDAQFGSQGSFYTPRPSSANPYAQRLAFKVALLDEGNSRPLTLRLEGDATDSLIPPPYSAVWKRAPGETRSTRTTFKGIALCVEDAEGTGVRFFFPNLP